jgi:xanthosine utilization system XapX-like protein
VSLGLVVGLALGVFFAFLITIGSPYTWQIMLPGGLLGLIVGYVTQQYGTRSAPREAAAAR